jgi:large subunit ribosomal protein L4
VNRKAARQAFRSALAAHVQAGSLALLDGASFGEPSTKRAAGLIAAAGLVAPIVVVLTEEEVAAGKSFRNLQRVAVVDPSELEVGAVVWARTLLVSQAALPLVEKRAS